MSLTSRKITNFAKKVTDLPDRPSPAYTPSQIKSQFDSSPEELRVALNGAVDDLSSTTAGSSGAEQIGSAPITGLSGATPYAQIVDLKAKLDTEAADKFFTNVAVAGQSTVAAEIKADTLTLAGGTGITVTTNAATDTVTITATGNATPGAHASSHITGGADVIPDAVANGAAGLMSGSDKARLDTHGSSHITGGSDVIPNAVSGGNAGLLSGADKAKYDAVSVQGGSYGITGGTGTAYTVTASPALSSLADGTLVVVKIHADNTGAATINVNGLGVKTIKKSNGLAVSAGNLKLNSIYAMRYNGTNFILQGEGGEYGTAGAGEALAPYTVGTESGLVTGTIADRGTTANQSLTAQNQAFTVNAGYHRQTFSVTATYTAGPLTASGSATANTSNVVTVTGLGFQPKIVLIKLATQETSFSNYGTYVDISKFSSPPASGISEFDSATDIFPAFTITASGFSVTTSNPSEEFKYIAMA